VCYTLDMQCPSCSTQLVSEVVRGQVLEACSNCEGHFASHSALRSILLAQAEAPQAAAYCRPSPLSDSVRYRKCPACGETMLRKNFAGASGVVLDVCPEHGSWFDRGELSTIMTFAATGAWQHAEHDATERLKAKKQLDAFMQDLRLGTFEHGAGVAGLGEVARLIPLDGRPVGKGKGR
jgi:Zn-finger nucleic acid-binding protein